MDTSSKKRIYERSIISLSTSINTDKLRLIELKFSIFNFEFSIIWASVQIKSNKFKQMDYFLNFAR